MDVHAAADKLIFLWMALQEELFMHDTSKLGTMELPYLMFLYTFFIRGFWQVTHHITVDPHFNFEQNPVLGEIPIKQ